MDTGWELGRGKGARGGLCGDGALSRGKEPEGKHGGGLDPK